MNSSGIVGTPLVASEDLVVLDASALLCAIEGETGHDVVLRALPVGVISSVNLSEVVAKLAERGLDDSEIRSVLAAVEVPVVGFSEEIAWMAGLLRPKTRAHGLSFGDRACLATGALLARPVVTADKAWLDLDFPVEVICVR